MKTTRTRLAVLISVLGAGLSASHRAWAEDAAPPARGAWGAASFADDTSPTHRMDEGALDRRVAFAAPALPALPAPAPRPPATREASALALREPTPAEEAVAPALPCEPPDDGPEPSAEAAAGASTDVADAVPEAPAADLAPDATAAEAAPSALGGADPATAIAPADQSGDDSAAHLDAAAVVASLGLDAAQGDTAAPAADAATAAGSVAGTAGSEATAVDDEPITETVQAVAPEVDSEAAMTLLAAVVLDAPPEPAVPSQVTAADASPAVPASAGAGVETQQPGAAAVAGTVAEAELAAAAAGVAETDVAAATAGVAHADVAAAADAVAGTDVAAATAAVAQGDVAATGTPSVAAAPPAKAGKRDRAERREPRTVVASQAEKVLANLSTVLADSAGHPALLERPSDHFLVASHEEQVLLTLAAVLTDGAAPPSQAAVPTTAEELLAADAQEDLAAEAQGHLAAEAPAGATAGGAVDIELPLDLAVPLALLPPGWGAGGLVAAPALDIDLTLPDPAALPDFAAAPAEAASAAEAAATEPAATPAAPNPLGTALALGPAQLEDLRGGFTTNEGLKVSFGIERATYINGNLVTTTSFNVADPSRPATAQPATGGGERNTLSLVQNGPGNSFQAGPLAGSSVGTVIQNTLNDQKIQNVTVINATVNSLQLLRNLNLQSTLRGAVIDSLRR